jgi:hypothetical protein
MLSRLEVVTPRGAGEAHPVEAPVLLAAAGEEPPDAAPLWKHAAEDRCATIASAVGADRRGEPISATRETGEEKCLGNRSEKRQFAHLGFSVEAETAPATPLGERCIENWAGALHSEAVRYMLPVVPQTKMEIPG